MLKMSVKSAFYGAAFIAIANPAFAQDGASILPPGYEMKAFESGWLGPGNNREAVCAGLVRAAHPNRRYQVMSTDEEQKFRVPEFRIDAQYKYRCTVLIAPN